MASLEPGQQAFLLRDVASALSRHSTATAVGPDLIDATREESVAALTTREAWIYRDWQAAIGDWMLIQNSDGVRRFDVRSYRSFVAAELQPDGDDREWVTRLHEVTDDLDVQGDRVHDARIEQLRQVYSAVATSILRFHDAEPELSAVGDSTAISAKARGTMIDGSTLAGAGPATP